LSALLQPSPTIVRQNRGGPLDDFVADRELLRRWRHPAEIHYHFLPQSAGIELGDVTGCERWRRNATTALARAYPTANVVVSFEPCAAGCAAWLNVDGNLCREAIAAVALVLEREANRLSAGSSTACAA
jgi:hypothetical protein